MARLPRLTLPGVAHHILQRGNNGQPIFSGPADYQLMLSLLEEHARAQRVAIHAYVLMPDHFQLLATPETSEGVAQTMQALGRAYVRYFNGKQGRTGTLFEGRYRSTLLEAERYLLSCMVYTDLEPVRSQAVLDPSDYPWSSHSHYAGRAVQRFLAPHPVYWALGNTPFAREAAYRDRVQAGLTFDEARLLRESVWSGWPVGGVAFLQALERRSQRRVAKGRPGRPRRNRDLSPNMVRLHSAPEKLEPDPI